MHTHKDAARPVSKGVKGSLRADHRYYPPKRLKFSQIWPKCKPQLKNINTKIGEVSF